MIAKIKITSDGTPFGTRVYADDRELSVFGLSLRFDDPTKPARLILELAPDEVLVDGYEKPDYGPKRKPRWSP